MAVQKVDHPTIGQRFPQRYPSKSGCESPTATSRNISGPITGAAKRLPNIYGFSVTQRTNWPTTSFPSQGDS